MTFKPSSWTPPPCPVCTKQAMVHKLFSVGDQRNGWYCGSCGAGSYQLGSLAEAKENINTEAIAAQFAIALLNK